MLVINMKENEFYEIVKGYTECWCTTAYQSLMQNEWPEGSYQAKSKEKNLRIVQQVFDMGMEGIELTCLLAFQGKTTLDRQIAAHILGALARKYGGEAEESRDALGALNNMARCDSEGSVQGRAFFELDRMR